MRKPPWITPRGVLALSGWAALAATRLPVADPLRVALTTAFLLFCPGLALVLRARPTPGPLAAWPGRSAAAALVVALSTSAALLVAVVFFLGGVFTVARALAVLAALTTALVLLPRRHRTAPEQVRRPSKPPPTEAGAVRPPPPAAAPPGPGRRTAQRRAGGLLVAVLLLSGTACGGALGSSGRPLTADPEPSGTPGTAQAPVLTDQPVAPGPWHQVFRDDFDGTVLNSADWVTCYDWVLGGGCTNAGNGEEEWYQPGQVGVADGVLTLNALRGKQHGSDGRTYPWASGMVSTGRDSYDSQPRHTFTYGYFAAAINVPAEPAGFFPAFWLIPAETRGTPPELDIAEFPNSNQSVNMNLHWRTPDGNDAHVGRFFGPADFASGYHVFALDWEPDSVTWYVDGVQRFQVTDASQVPNVAMELVINLAVGYLQSPPPTVDSAQLHVQWVGVWQH
ncbi:glycoside hydrolase family 16 protein [Kitasatospora sp. NBC_00240]|uniref:glycoside hydrolase family 16 protein n=1 Tax=Kitasatospora sp. NBC_00240 TaxID=2903567 RepID=UPI0022557B25|nr:glycoside hydrolase family 16 protein [Kitasatospora sp. NBC_00240]MCX5209447.1 glycoside hydrolase family 16 protein [Kitasatospora sp. NBC_00240]